jgi:hypothetical protein
MIFSENSLHSSTPKNLPRCMGRGLILDKKPPTHLRTKLQKRGAAGRFKIVPAHHPYTKKPAQPKGWTGQIYF